MMLYPGFGCQNLSLLCPCSSTVLDKNEVLWSQYSRKNKEKTVIKKVVCYKFQVNYRKAKDADRHCIVYRYKV